MILSNKPIKKGLISLRECAGWSAPLLFANPRRQVFSRRGPYILGLMYQTRWKIHLLTKSKTLTCSSASFNFCFMAAIFCWVLKYKRFSNHCWNKKYPSEEMTNPPTLSRGPVWKLILARGQVNCLKILVHKKFYLTHIKEKTMHKDFREALTVLIQYTCINSLKQNENRH